MFNLESQNFYADTQANVVYSSTRYDVTSYFLSAFIEVSNKGQKLESNFCVLAFAWPNQLVGFLFLFLWRLPLLETLRILFKMILVLEMICFPSNVILIMSGETY